MWRSQCSAAERGVAKVKQSLLALRSASGWPAAPGRLRCARQVRANGARRWRRPWKVVYGAVQRMGSLKRSFVVRAVCEQMSVASRLCACRPKSPGLQSCGRDGLCSRSKAQTGMESRRSETKVRPLRRKEDCEKWTAEVVVMVTVTVVSIV